MSRIKLKLWWPKYLECKSTHDLATSGTTNNIFDIVTAYDARKGIFTKEGFPRCSKDFKMESQFLSQLHDIGQDTGSLEYANR